jgi:hypothetical protein
MVYTLDLKSDARIGLMGSIPIGATICSSLFSGGVSMPASWCMPSPTGCDSNRSESALEEQWVISSTGRAPDF